MKYIVMLGDGMADYPVEALGRKDTIGGWQRNRT